LRTLIPPRSFPKPKPMNPTIESMYPGTGSASVL
jgi:hypothetical protein